MLEFANNLVESMVLGRSLSQPEAQDFILENYRAERLRDVTRIEYGEGEMWLFDYGVLVCWGVVEELKSTFIAKLGPYIEDRSKAEEFEQYAYTFGVEESRMHREHIYLATDDNQARLAVSHALAQSVKLSMFERMAQTVIQENEFIPRTLAVSGRIPLGRRDIAKLRGVLFSVKSDILLNFNLLDTPEYFWDYPELEPLYSQVAHYLDVVSRITVLSKKLETIHELLEMLANEQNHKHSSLLEWIIIILIAVEIVLFFWH